MIITCKIYRMAHKTLYILKNPWHKSVYKLKMLPFRDTGWRKMLFQTFFAIFERSWENEFIFDNICQANKILVVGPKNVFRTVQ